LSDRFNRLHPLFIFIAHGGDFGVDLFPVCANHSSRLPLRPNLLQDLKGWLSVCGRDRLQRNRYRPGRQINFLIDLQSPARSYPALNDYLLNAHDSNPCRWVKRFSLMIFLTLYRNCVFSPACGLTLAVPDVAEDAPRPSILPALQR
jgi:hypothetical protein